MNKVILYVVILAFAVVAIPPGHAQETPRDGVLIHISHGADDPHRLLMALNMAGMMADDHDVLVYFDIEAVNVVLKDAEEVTLPHFPSSKMQVRTLLDKGVHLMACPGCLKVAGKTKDDLANGIHVADKSRFFTFTEGRILTLDY